MRKYEVIVTYDPDLNEQGVTEQLTKLRELIASFDGQVLKEENSGKIPLAYPMKKKSYGTYVLLIIEAKPEFVEEFTRQMRINDVVLRFMACVRDEASGDGIKRAEERSSRPAPGRGDRYSKDRDRGSSYRDKNPKTEDAKEEATKASTDSKSTDSKSAESESAAEATA